MSEHSSWTVNFFGKNYVAIRERQVCNDPESMTMQELLDLQEKIGTKAFKKSILKQPAKPHALNHRLYGLKKQVDDSKPQEVPLQRKVAPLVDKSKPRELPLQRKVAPFVDKSKPREVPLQRKVAPLPSTKFVNRKLLLRRDPRFDDLSGTFAVDKWRKNYRFITEKRLQEMNILKEELAKETEPAKKKRMKLVLQKMENQEREQKKRMDEKEIRKKEREDQISSLKEGRKPKFLSRKEKRLLLKAKQFESLKKEHRLDKYLKKKEQKQHKKEMKHN